MVTFQASRESVKSEAKVQDASEVEVVLELKGTDFFGKSLKDFSSSVSFSCPGGLFALEGASGERWNVFFCCCTGHTLDKQTHTM